MTLPDHWRLVGRCRYPGEVEVSIYVNAKFTHIDVRGSAFSTILLVEEVESTPSMGDEWALLRERIRQVLFGDHDFGRWNRMRRRIAAWRKKNG